MDTNLTMTTTDSPPAPKRKSWLRRLAWLAATLVVLLVVSYFVVTSAAFLKGVILPKVSQAMNAKVTVTDASIQPFSLVTLKGVSVQTLGPEPAVTVEEVRLRYSLTSILGGTIKVEEIALVNPKIRIEQNADGTSNLDPITKNSGTKPAAQPPTSSGPSQPPKVDISKVTLSDGLVQVIQKGANGVETRIKLEKLNFALTDVRNGQTARLILDGVSQWYSGTSASNSSATINLKSEFNIGLTPLLELAMAKGGISVSIGGATGAFAQLSGIRTMVECDITPSEVKQLAWRTFNGARLLSEMTVTGPLDLAKKEGIAENGFRLIVNCNKHGGQVVYHLHMHLVGGAPLGPMLSGGTHG
jgi:hypothetical protein